MLIQFFQVNAQCKGDCQAIDTNIGEPSNGGEILNNDWSYSHGTPNIGPDGFWLWSNGGFGEGINFSGYHFQAGEEYCIQFVAETSTNDRDPADPSSFFEIVATQNPVVGMVNMPGGGAPIPTIPTGSQVIFNQIWSNFSGGGFSGVQDFYQFNFTANSDFYNLWFYPSSSVDQQVEIAVMKIEICHLPKPSPKCDCENGYVNMNIGHPSNGGPITNENWSYSHGSPTVSPNGFWLWSNNSRGEGINYNGYHFKRGREYCIEFRATTDTHNGTPANPNAFFEIVATQNPVIGTVLNSNGAPIPPRPAGSQVIFHQNWANFSGGGFNGVQNVYQFNFTATDDFNNLWFYPSSPTLPQVEISINEIRICEISEPCEVNYTVELRDAGNGKTNVTVNPIVTTSNIINMELYNNFSLVYSGPIVSNILAPGSYTIVVTAVSPTGEKCTKTFEFCFGNWKNSEREGSHDGKRKEEDFENNFSGKYDGENFIKESPENSIMAELLKISPNPNKGEFTISSDSELKIQKVIIYGSDNRLIKEVQLNKTKSLIQINEKPGIYMIQILLENDEILTKKVVIL